MFAVIYRIGSCLHKGKDSLWVAYSRWLDKATRDAAKEQNKDLENYDEICLEVVEDLLLGRAL